MKNWEEEKVEGKKIKEEKLCVEEKKRGREESLVCKVGRFGDVVFVGL
jgi:hypothetical protein